MIAILEKQGAGEQVRIVHHEKTGDTDEAYIEIFKAEEVNIYKGELLLCFLFSLIGNEPYKQDER